MNELVYPNEQKLGSITLFLGLIVWLGLIIGTYGIALAVLAIGFLFYLFAQSALIGHIKGNGVELSEAQYPDLYSQLAYCCERLEIKQFPQAYVLNGNGGLNAFATKFLGSQYLVLMSDVVDAMREHKDGVRFYIGHELGHLRRKHLSGHFFRWPVLWLPLLGAAYSRACETTCDRHGLACSSSPEEAAKALAALATGSERWKDLNISAYLSQTSSSSGFWMSFHELTAGYPWLTKRAARIADQDRALPKRNAFAYLLAIFVPYAGRLGGAFGLLILVYIIGVMAAIGLPAYRDYVVRAKVTLAYENSKAAQEILGNYYETNDAVPASLAAAGIDSELDDGSLMSLNPKNMVLTVSLSRGEFLLIPNIDDEGRIFWMCGEGEGLQAVQLPASCPYYE